MTLHVNGCDWDNGNRAKCEKHGLSVATIEDLLPDHWLCCLTRPTHSVRNTFVP